MKRSKKPAHEMYKVGPGRVITGNGVELVELIRCYDLNSRTALKPSEADDLVNLIVKLLNEHEQKVNK